jgi:hypothetical protein
LGSRRKELQHADSDKRLRHQNGACRRRLLSSVPEAAAAVETNGTGVNVRIDAAAVTLDGKLRREVEQLPAVATSLQVIANGDPTKDGDIVVDIDANHTDRGRAIPE